MAVANGQPGNENTFNNALASKTRTNSFKGIQELDHSGSGSTVTNVQFLLNNLMASLGFASEGDPAPDYYGDPGLLFAIGNGQNRKVAIAALDSALKTVSTLLDQVRADVPKNELNEINDPNQYRDAGEGFTEGSIIYNTTNGSLWMCTDPTDDEAVWIQVGGSGGGGGAGGSTAWINGDIAPQDGFLHGIETKDFALNDAQEMFLNVIVPSSYIPGEQIFLINGMVVSDASGGDILLRTETTLIRPGWLSIDESEQYTSTNTEVSLSGSLNLENLGNLDLCDENGAISGVAIQAGDLLKIRLYRDSAGETSSADSKASFLKYSASVSFKEL